MNYETEWNSWSFLRRMQFLASFNWQFIQPENRKGEEIETLWQVQANSSWHQIHEEIRIHFTRMMQPPNLRAQQIQIVDN